MNREIKFRIRLVCIKDGDGYKVDDKLTMFNEPFDRLNGVAFYPINSQVWEVVSYEQSTGLKDKNGKEIYEGDILNVCDWGGEHTSLGIASVEWDSDEIGWRYSKGLVEDAYDMYKSLNFSEIIGNIYENPELLNP